MSEKEEEKKIEVRKPEEREMESWYPRDLFREFDDRLEEFRRNFWRDFWSPFPHWRRLGRPWWPRAIEPFTRRREASLDLVDRGKEFEVRVEVPGIPKENIEVNITKDGLEISGKAQVERREEERDYMIRERGYAEVYRRIALPEEVVPEKATASLKNGLLEIKIPKKTPALEERKHKVEIV